MALTERVPFHGCCGATVIYLGAYTTYTSTLINEVKDHLKALKGGSGLGVMILNEVQHDLLFKDLKVMGWTKFKTPAKNPNTSNDLHLYMIDINKFEAKKAKKVFGK